MGKDEVEAAIAALDESLRRTDFWILVFGAIVAISLSIEAIFSVRHWILERQLRPLRVEQTRIHDAELAATQERAASAEARAAEAQLALERFKAPRRLTQEQYDHFIAVMKSYAGTPFDLSVNPGPESQALMMQIASALEAAGWQWRAAESQSGLSINIPGKPAASPNTSLVGLGVEIDVSKVNEWGHALSVLVGALREADIQTIGNVATDGSASPNAVHIYVGQK